MKRVLVSVALLLSCLCTFSQVKEKPYVLLVSFDGFRHDYLTKFDLPNFKTFISSGVRAEALIPCFPSKTFPNHYSIVTGLYPGNHGLVDNSFFDPAHHEKFTMANKTLATNTYYFGGTPLWRLAQQQGMKVAPFFWVGSEAPFDNQFPDYYQPYESTVANSQRVEQLRNWLHKPQADKPHFMTLYFSLVDDAGHDFGPESPQLKTNVLEADRLLGNIMEIVKADGENAVNVVVVSDHGMKELTYQPDTYIYLNDLLDPNDTSINVVNNGTHAHIYIKDKNKVEEVYKKLNGADKNLSVYRSGHLPKQWHYENPRTGELFITAAPGKELTAKSREKIAASMKLGASWGVHGYDPDVVTDMHGIFCAAGPNIKKSAIIPAFRNINVYPFIAQILQLKTPVIDGSKEVLKGIYQP